MDTRELGSDSLTPEIIRDLLERFALIFKRNKPNEYYIEFQGVRFPVEVKQALALRLAPYRCIIEGIEFSVRVYGETFRYYEYNC